MIAVLALVSIVSWSTALLISTDVNVRVADQTISAVVADAAQISQSSQAWVSRGKSPVATIATTNNLHRGLVVSLSNFAPKVLGALLPDFSQISKEQAIQLVRPGVVSIINKLDGSYKISDFDIPAGFCGR